MENKEKMDRKKRAKTKAGIKAMSLTQIILLVSMSFAISFLMSDNFVSADAGLAVAGGLAGGAVIGLAGAIGAPSLALTGGSFTFGNLFGGSLLAGGSSGQITFLSGAANTIITAALYAIIWAAAAYLISELLGLDGDVQRAFIPAAAVGGSVMGALMGISAAVPSTSIWAMSTWAALGWGLAVVAIMFVFTYKKTIVQTISFTCLPWQAQKGGAKCEECNKNPFIPCTEYRCKSLGQQCEIRNAELGTGVCVSVGRNDTLAPEISPWEGALSPQELSYTGFGVRPPSLGIKITDSRTSGGCIQPFSRFQFGLATKEPAECTMSWTNNFTTGSSMFFKELTIPSYNHTTQMSLPNQAINGTDLSPILQSDGTFTLFVRCEDAAGNYNVDSYAVNFCVDPSPDTKAPIIEDTSIKSGSPIAYGTYETPLTIFTNELAQCKWSRQNQGFETMENYFTCASNPTEINANLQYACSGKLTGIENNKDNKFYFGCNDSLGNVMPLNKEFILKSSQQLSILDITPSNGTTIRGGSSVILADIEVKTDDGAENGKAFCAYKSPNYAPKEYQFMFETGTSDTSKQTGLQLPPGNYTYYIKCTDIGGNVAEGITIFNVFSDLTAPQVTRVYKTEPSSLKVTTNEDATCVYSTNDCNYAMSEGIQLTYLLTNSKKIHLAPWEIGKTYFIKCKDEFENEPSSNDCSVIAKMV